MRELTAADYKRIRAQLAAMQRVNMWGPGRLALVAMLLIQLARTEPVWALPPDPLEEAQRAMMRLFDPKPAPAPVVCPPPMRAAVLPRLDAAETWLLARAATAAVHGRVRLWAHDFREIAELHPARPPGVGWAACRGEGCPWCAWAVDPTPDKLPAFVMWKNPYLPREQAEWVTAEIGGYRVSGPANQQGVRLFEGEALW
ncbi:hypothetical protein IU459_11925 [Nocardia amamiensis]|uniref:Uncharacterized protein n=1 Tax=Nocardia amamiensis TaxID=404578 RepID=A0ABS0CNS6_9NOCA|nr:hypothetical protein [Nocardia amamiensis]MBF6298249.1 hypothetical protein [Nocardia amamiensis]